MNRESHIQAQEDSARKFSRRDVLKAGAATGLATLVPVFKGETRVSADAGTTENTNVFSQEVVEFLNSPIETQADVINSRLEEFNNASFNHLSKVGKLYGKLNSQQFPTTNPPRITRDVVQACLDNGPYYYIANRNNVNEGIPSVGLVVDITDPSTVQTDSLGSFTNAFLTGISAHTFQSEKGPIKVHIGHFAGYYGEDKKDRFDFPGFLGGWSPVDSSKNSYNPKNPSKSWIEANPKSQEDNQSPFYRYSEAAPSVSYESTINRFFDTIGKSLVTVSIGASLNIAEQNYPQGAAQLGFPPEFFSDKFQYGNDKTNRQYYDWLTWKALNAAVGQDEGKWALWSHPMADWQMSEIGDVYPDTLDASTEPKVTHSDYFLGAKDAKTGKVIAEPKDTVTTKDLMEIPWIYPSRLAVSSHTLFTK